MFFQKHHLDRNAETCVEVSSGSVDIYSNHGPWGDDRATNMDWILTYK